ncbi:hypothetical protein A3L12_08065 [Thermococcus sp. P6]|uniref:hypothetical protein n=1 Tax=Thermococcus sp. P6 TaxID=122420 RepID=UPI000B59DBE1|nr:hypothetical protein [Thermococcus sp. P6]ASJ11251.1 hypothetical protein A3L12_08065 [Thermococcus sp. P6]
MTIASMDAQELDWKDILPEPFVVLILGMRGAGKTALGHYLLEYFGEQGKRKPAYIIGFPAHKRHLLPSWIKPLDELYFPDNSVVLLHEAHFYLHARRSMNDQNIEIDKLITVSRHKNVDIIIETQQSFRLDKNVVAEVDALIFRAPELMQERFERQEVRFITNRAKEAFSPYIKEYNVVRDGEVVGRYMKLLPEAKKKAYIYGKNYEGMFPHDIPLPSYWSDEISRAYGELKEKKEEEVEEAEGMVGKILKLIKKKPKYAEYFRSMLEWEEENKDSEYFDLGFEWSDVRVPPQVLSRLYLDGILELVYNTRRHKAYLLKDREAVREALEKLET